MHVSDVFTQRTQISPLTLDVTTNRYFIVQRGTPNIYWKITTIVISHSQHTHDRYNSPTVQHNIRGHYSFLSRSWTLFIPFTSVDTIHTFHVRGHSRPWTLFIPFTSVHTIHSFHVRGHYSFLSRPWTLFIPFTFFSLRDCSLNQMTSLRTWVSTPPVVSTRLIPQAAPT